MRMSVVLPAPFGPRRPKTMPSGTSRSTPARAVVDPNRLTTPRTPTAGGRPRRHPLVSGCDNELTLLRATTQVGGGERAHRHRYVQAEPPPHLGQPLTVFRACSNIDSTV